MFNAVDKKYFWTNHVRNKMRQYRLTESRIKRIIRHPTRTEEGVLENAVACMQPAGGRNYSEIWTMYLLVKSNVKGQMSKVRIITAWRYPGKSPARDPIPADVLREIRNLI